MEQPVSAAREYEAELSHRTLVSEQRRALILSVVLTLLSAIIWMHSLTMSRTHELYFVYHWLGGLVVGAALYEGFLSWMLLKMVRSRRSPARWRLYANAFVELAMPTITAWFAAEHIPPSHAITGLATYPYFLIILLSTLRLDFRLCLFTGFVASAGFTTLCLAHWPELEAAWGGPLSGVHFGFFMRAIMYLVLGVVAAIVSGRIRQTLEETMSTMQERERIMHRFGQHLSPEVVNLLLTKPPLPELRDVCIMVLDIRNFTTYSEDRPADEVVEYLNTLWGFMVKAVKENHGDVNKFLGDGFLAIFGAPVSSGEDCKNALAASQRILRELGELSATGRLPETNVGIALHSGRVIAGEFGTDLKKEYSVIGDVVNVAFRIEALNKEFGTRLLISGPVRESAGVDGMDKVHTAAPIRGRHETVELYKVA